VGRRTAEPVDLAAAPMSFERFYEAERVRIGRAIALALGDVDLAAEATDEAFTRAYERWPAVARGNPPAWVYRVAMNWALSVLRRRKVRRNRPLYELPAGDVAIGEPAVHEALAALDPKHRSVVVCRHLLGWSVAETAAALHLREGTVKSRLSRATQILQSRLHHLRPEEQA
jgi:RNA polymerase sigma-70 factor (ECF subfamily)